MDMIVVAAFYKFVSLPDCEELRSPLLQVCQAHQVKGTILLAKEGINGTIAGERFAIDAVLNYLRADDRLVDLEPKESEANQFPFERMKVKLKREIVTLGVPEANPANQVGSYVDAKDWNALITDPNVVVVDTRNEYEVAIGTFKGAHNPHTASFQQFPAYVDHHLDPTQHRQVALFCTGGIRCEKATSLLLSKGFEQVYHLKGGILKYLEDISPEDSLWEGECFVFDERVAVQHGVKVGTHGMCRSCGHPITAEDQSSPHYQEGICCPHCYDTLTPEKRSRQEERQRQFQPPVQLQPPLQPPQVQRNSSNR